VGELLERSQQVDDNLYYLHRVDEVVLLGPFLATNAERIKDADKPSNSRPSSPTRPWE
jgi:hypothetical protein